MKAFLNHYAVLGLDARCSEDQIRAAYRILAKQLHPDVNGGSEESIARTQALNAAYETLSDPGRRQAYDEEREREASSHRKAARKAGGSALRNVAQDILLPLEDFFRGTTLDVRVNDPGNPDGSENYELVVPPDTSPGARFRLPRSGVMSGGTVTVRVRLRPDFRFQARGSDLRCDLRVSYQLAAQGGLGTVTGPTGRRLSVSIPRNVGRNEVLRVPGEGLPTPRGGRGDLLVRITYRPEVRVARRARV